jgi:hypothetical protein
VYLKYIKAINKKEYKLEEVDAVSTYYNISKHEAKEYIDLIDKDELEIIKQQVNGVY